MNPGRFFHERRAVRPLLRWIVPFSVILLAVAVSADPTGSGPATSTGVQVTKSVPFARESIDEIRALAPMRERAVPEDRAIPLRRIQRRSGATGEAESPFAGATVAAPSAPSSPGPSAPALDGSFAGLGNPPHTEGDVIPPDTMGAAGPNHLVSILNSDFGVFNKTTGAPIPNQQISLQSFWGSLDNATVQPSDFPFDPKILYDQHSGRFVAVTLGGRSAPGSWVMIAVSSTPDPTGTWDKWAIDADLYNGVTQTNNSADYPGFGVDQFNVYVTANMFDVAGNAQHGKVWVIPKPQLLTNPGATIALFEFTGAFLSGFSRQPAHTFGAAAAQYLVSEGAPSQLLLTRIDNTSSTPVLQPPVPVAVSAYPFTDSTPGAPQLGNDNTIDTSDTRVLNAVYRNGSVWATHHVVGPSGKVEVAWYRINPGSGTVQSQGRVADPNRWYYYPSIAVNKDNVAAIGFSGSSTAEYVGGYYTIVRPSSNVAEAVNLLKAGEAPYWKTLTGTENRWGDFSATVVDPSDDMTFWTLQEYAQTPDPATGSSRWGTWWGTFHPSDVAAPSGLSATAGAGVQVTLTWTDSSVNELGFRIERRLVPAGGYSVIATVGPNITSFVDNTDTGLAAGPNYYYRVESFNAGGGAYSNEANVTTPSAPAAAGGGGGGCLSMARSGGGPPDVASLISAGILLLPACALGLRRFFRRRKRAAPIRHPLC
jgi:hypothetical protein